MVSECCLKMGTPFFGCGLVTETSEWCKIALGFCSCSLKPPTTFCKGQGQTFCCVTQYARARCALEPTRSSVGPHPLVSRGAVPCDHEVPMTCAVCGWSCYPKCGCCAKLGDLTATVPAMGAPPINEMAR